ncbi:tRNA (adenosine(37)-N6)-dimethylallyltransferase MiaA [Agromyces atrinae]|uniref:tRNA dimethylallyltransferase n=1 Tax=Agromyces atrinae TaxID=592376 RepID=A0A4Q2MDG5_9MICO|nr:tRNA (adenosine(37)-N6)-dimethylallyltransferase MiaA [Agromyces atrinae]NYD66461.1 tRNA dimethylallyltransferase [Agromyces atrinae]RXZ87140.1 tRNA (adenosine(37)-N6)-dimethylallyltransferase MiaA [Agromyces atrinae]
MSVVAVVGATGTGKSAFALDVAEEIARHGGRAEVVNADAMQLYRGMDIGTAKLAVGERRGVPHHLFDVLDVTEEASVARYQVEARAAIDAIIARGAVPILVGGSGLYVSSVLFDFQFPGTDAAVRARLEDELERLGPGILARRLADLDAETAAAIGSTNGRRIVRALEVIEITGEPAAARLPDEPLVWREHRTVMLTTPRDVLVDRLDRRVEAMWADGIIDEVRRLLPLGIERGVTASRAIGYRQAIDEIHGTVSRDEAIAETQRLTRRYARRQVGWFSRYREAALVDSGDATAVREQIARLSSLD